MTYCKNGVILCDTCGKFCTPFDEETPFGTKSYDYPEPLDPYHYCQSCWPDLKKDWLNKLSKNPHSGYWQKSRAEREAADELELVWLHSSGIGTYGTETYKQPYQYISKKEYEELSKLPRFINQKTSA